MREKGMRKLKTIFESANMIKIANGISIVSPYPALLLEKENAIVVSDVHIGIEAAKNSRGTQIPNCTIAAVIDSVKRPVERMSARWVYILGDIKHRFGPPNETERMLIEKFVREIRKAGAEIIVIRGNHDINISPMLQELHVKYFNNLILESGILLTHGHKRFRIPSSKKIEFRSKLTIIGHEHPAIRLSDDLGVPHIYKAFLHVPGNGSSIGDVIVLPSVSFLAYGSCVNEMEDHEYLSPYLRGNPNLKKARPYAIEVGGLVLPFPELGRLSRISSA